MTSNVDRCASISLETFFKQCKPSTAEHLGTSSNEHIWPLQVLLLENVRFHKQEEKNDPEFAKQVHGVPDASHVQTATKLQS